MSVWAYLDIGNPMVAWLAYRGEVFSVDHGVPGALSIFAARRLRGATRGSDLLATELELDQRRQLAHPDQASRLAGFYAFESEADAIRAAKEWGIFVPGNLTELEVDGTSVVTRRDSQWITHEMASGVGPWIDEYLSGHSQGPDELIELTIEGSAAIINTELRERAGEVVRATWPEVELPLEVGRIAYLLGYPIGRMMAYVMTEPDGKPAVRYILNFDANDPAFIADFSAALADPDFPRNSAALQPIDEDTFFRIPDMQPYEFSLT